MRKPRNRKFMGHTDGTKTGNPNAIKGEDYIKYGYPHEVRHKSEIKHHIEDDITKEYLKSLSDD
jgi:hypothetical protein